MAPLCENHANAKERRAVEMHADVQAAAAPGRGGTGDRAI
jgi:hypothetical protein